MRVTLLATLALLLAFAAAPSRAADWTTYRYPDLGFSALFPAPPTRVNKPMDTSAGPIPTEFIYVQADAGLYFISSSDLTSQPESLNAPDRSARGILDGALQSGTVVSAPAHLAAAAGWEGTAQSEGKLIRVRTYVRGKHGLTVMIIAPAGHPERVTDAAASRFFAGFSPDAH